MFKSLSTLIKPSNLGFLRRGIYKPYMRMFSTTEIPKTEKAEEARENSEKENENNLYYPIKRINFAHKTEFPIYQIDEKKIPRVPLMFRLAGSYAFFLTYGITYIFFLDINNLLHLIPLSFLFYRGCSSMFTESQLEASRVKSLFIKKSGTRFVATLFKKPHFWNLRDDIELVDYPETEDDVKFEFNIKDVLRIGFLQDLQRRVAKDPNFIQLKASKIRNLEGELKNEMQDRGLEEDDEEEKRHMLILIERKNQVVPLHIDLELNMNKAYNDYLVALAQGKTLVMREAKDN